MVHKSIKILGLFSKLKHTQRPSFLMWPHKNRKIKCSLWPMSLMVSVNWQSSSFLTVFWIHCRCSCLSNNEAQLSFHWCPQRDTTVHLQGLGPAFILVAGLTVLHTLMETTKDNKKVTENSKSNLKAFYIYSYK